MSGPTRVYWHRELPPLRAEVIGDDSVEASSHRVADILDRRNALWDECHAALMAEATRRVIQEVERLGGDCAHVVDERLETKRHDPSGEAWLQGRFKFVVYRTGAARTRGAADRETGTGVPVAANEACGYGPQGVGHGPR